jgi:PII-like signaling protein
MAGLFTCQVHLGMKMPTEDGYLLRIFVGESDRHGHHPLYESIVLTAREHGLAGATVTRGLMGYGKNSVLHTAKILRLSEDLPMVIEIVDNLAKIESFLPILDGMVNDGLVTLETVRIIHHRP